MASLSNVETSIGVKSGSETANTSCLQCAVADQTQTRRLAFVRPSPSVPFSTSHLLLPSPLNMLVKVKVSPAAASSPYAEPPHPQSLRPKLTDSQPPNLICFQDPNRQGGEFPRRVAFRSCRTLSPSTVNHALFVSPPCSVGRCCHFLPPKIEIDIEPTDKVARIKERVEEKEGIPPPQQRLV
ncbi:hypothetical protein BDK51DRAFT_47802 [Blyttiomyces helicus]|uniref:Ubiquitin-like domain-containing protein n=1 Tax=Blyttiomyces helicus TaxID=388810 RepID=A0A4V1IQ81_9FUNG|nr:hypothetical protein BDK51DRAFT_47802 [Blyttiomyces helicus]|eukprot:RKO85637.1 hypothetical protein BDK51DRAFT_47802 [Blyttiomyces helicus]